MSTADVQRIGSISLLDLDIISRSQGRDFLPYPFMFTQPSRFTYHHEYVDYAASVPDRFNNGDLRIFRRCALSYAHADIRVECHVQSIPADTPSVRVVAYRVDQLGFLATQRPDDDIVDVDELSPYLLGRAVSHTVALTRPGRRSEIVIPEYVAVSDNANAPEGLGVRQMIDTSSVTKVPRADVTAVGTVQSHWRPARRWGLDPGKSVVVWVRIKDDGEYIYTADFSEARPMTGPTLAERIDQLIAEDVKVLRQLRSG
jgi:hypothetical protein